MKLGMIYTSTTPELIEFVNRYVSESCGQEAELANYEDPSIISDATSAGYVTTQAANKLVTLYTQAIHDGCDALLNICSSVGEVADSMQDYARYVGIPIVRIDEEMCREAVRLGKRIGVLATVPTTLTPTKNTLMRVSRELGKPITLVDGMVDNAFGIEETAFKERLSEVTASIKDDIDVLLLCQGSMAYAASFLEETYHLPVLSSPAFGARELKKALLAKGLLH